MLLEKLLHHLRFKLWFERFRQWGRRLLWHKPTENSSQEFTPKIPHDHALVLSITRSTRFPRWQQLRFLSRALTQQERRVFWLGLVISILAFLVGISQVATNHLIAVPKTGGTVSEALVGSPKLINPLFAPLNDVDRDLTALIYSGLFRIDERLEPQLDLARSFTWLNQGRTLEVNLRDDIFFHDGESVTADDVVFTYQTMKSWRSPLANVFRGINVIRINTRTVQFQLEKPHLEFLSLLNLGILPAHLWSEVPETSATLAEINIKPIGSGPYQAVSFTRDSKGGILAYHLRAFPKYYGTPPFVRDWKFRFYADRLQAENALRGNQVDALAFVPWGEADRIKNKNLHRVNLELPQETVVFFHVKNALLKDERVRRALAMAVDRQELQTLLGSHVTPVFSPFPFLETTSGTPSDLEGARALLQKSNWQLRDGDPVRYSAPTNASSTPLTLTIDVPNQPDLLQVAEALKRRWSLVGARVQIRPQDAESLLREAVTNRSYQVLLWNILLPENQDLSPFWSSLNTAEHGLNLSNLEDREVDLALETVKNATSTPTLHLARQRLSDILVNRVGAIFLVRPAYAYVVSKRVKGVTDERIIRPSDRLRNTTHWYVKTQWKWK